MFSLEALREINEKAERMAKREGKEPLRVTLAQLREAQAVGTDQRLGNTIRGIPVFGEVDGAERAGFEVVKDADGEPIEFFADKTGHGADYEPAMTLSQLVDAMREATVQYGVSDDDGDVGNPALYWAAHNEGQFQLYVSAYLPSGAGPEEGWGEPEYCPVCGSELLDGEAPEDCSTCEHERTHCTECGKWIGDDGHDGRCLEHADPKTLDEEELAEMALELAR